MVCALENVVWMKSRFEAFVATWSQFTRACIQENRKKIIRSTKNTQKNEALHGVQARLYRKDLNHGNSIEYVFAMAAGVLKLSLGECYLPI